jgi:alkyl hydroperoxide reductase subunit F
MFTLDAPSEVEGTVDVLIIGAGPAGMTAAVYLARKKRSCAIVSKDIGGQVAWTLGIENYMGYQYVTGRELTAKFEEQVKQFPIPIVMDDAAEVRPGHEGFTVLTTGGRSLSARSVIVATGKRPKELGVPEEKRFVGRGLSYCATCDAPLFANQDVAICGGGNSAVQAAVELAQIASKVYIISRNPWRADAVVCEKADQQTNVEKRLGFDVLEVLGEKTVEGLRIRDRTSGREETIKVKGVFVEIGLLPNTEFVKGLLKLNEWGEVVVDCACETGIPGLFAAGDVTNVHEKQIVVAAGEGAKAALSAHEYLLRKPAFTLAGQDTSSVRA